MHVNLYGATLFRYHHHVCRTMVVCEVSGLSFLYMHLLVALIRWWCSRCWAASPIFIAHGAVSGSDRICPAATKLDLKRDFRAGLVAFNNDFDTQLKIWLAGMG